MLTDAELVSAQIEELFNPLSSKRKMLASRLSEFRDALELVALNQALLGSASIMEAMRQQEVTA